MKPAKVGAYLIRPSTDPEVPEQYEIVVGGSRLGFMPDKAGARAFVRRHQQMSVPRVVVPARCYKRLLALIRWYGGIPGELNTGKPFLSAAQHDVIQEAAAELVGELPLMWGLLRVQIEDRASLRPTEHMAAYGPGVHLGVLVAVLTFELDPRQVEHHVRIECRTRIVKRGVRSRTSTGGLTCLKPSTRT